MTVDLLALEQALSASTAGEWTWTDSGYTGWTGWEQWYTLEPYTGVKFDGEALNADAQFIALAHNVMPALVQELREARAQRTVLYGTDRVAAGRAKPEADDNEKWARIAYAAYISEQQNEFGGFDFNDLREGIKDSWRRVARDLLAVTILGDN